MFDKLYESKFEANRATRNNNLDTKTPGIPQEMPRPGDAGYLDLQDAARLDLFLMRALIHKARHLWPLALVTIIAALLRFYHIGKFELWADECGAVYAASTLSLESLVNENNPPFYYLLLHWWMVFGGLTEGAVRSLSAVSGLLVVPAVYGLVRSIRFNYHQALWSALLCALAPLQIHYSQETRAYAMVTLLFVLSVWALVTAIKREKWHNWLLFAALLACASMTHDLVWPLYPSLWIFTRLLGGRQWPWRRLLVSQLVTVALCSPWLIIASGQPKEQATSWIDSGKSSSVSLTSAWQSVEAFTIGGSMPSYLRLDSPGGWIRVTAILFFAAAFLLAFSSRRNLGHLEAGTDRPASAAVVALSVLMFTPLLFLLAYSLIRRPIYVVGRYDILAQPVFLAMCGIGLGNLHTMIHAGRAKNRPQPSSPLLALSAIAPILLVTLLAWTALAKRYAPLPANVVHHPQTLRGELLKTYGDPRTDLILCLGLESVKISYQVKRWHISVEWNTFPLSSRDHMGWFDPQATWKAQGENGLRKELESILSHFKSPGARYSRLWLVPDPYTGRGLSSEDPRYYYEAIGNLTLETLNENGFQREWLNDPRGEKLAQAGLLLYRPK